MRKIFFIICIFSFYVSSAQNVQFDLFKRDSSREKSNVFVLKLFNNQSHPIGIISSINFSKFSEQDTLQVAIGDWYNGNGKDYLYTIEKSVNESRVSEELPYCQLIVVNPQTYFITNVNLSDIDRYRDKNISFSLMYITNVSCNDLKNATDNKGNQMQIIKDKEYLLGKTTELTLLVPKSIK